MSHDIHDRTLALAGVFQAAWLVHQIATRGMTDNAALEASINSVFIQDADAVEDVFGDTNGVITGLSVMKRQFSAGKESYDQQITQYVVSLLHLANKARKRPQLMDAIGQGLEEAGRQAESFHRLHENVLAKLADVYQNTISTLPPKIIVQGQHGYLSNPDNANKVRSTLLAGIRAGILWLQCGGSRWQVLFRRKPYLEECSRILDRLRQ